MLKKIGVKWYVLSEKTRKNLGSPDIASKRYRGSSIRLTNRDYNTKKEAKKSLGQVEFFKRLKQTKGIKEGRKGRQR